MYDGGHEERVTDDQVAVRRLLSVTAAAYEQRAQLERALDSRIEIEQAKGVLAERFGLSMTEAFALLRQAARSHHRKLRDLARDVVVSRQTPEEIESEVERRP